MRSTFQRSTQRVRRSLLVAIRPCWSAHHRALSVLLVGTLFKESRNGQTCSHAQSDMERVDQLRAGQHPGEALQRRVAEDGLVQPARPPHRCPHQLPARSSARRRHEVPDEAHRQGLRAAIGRLRAHRATTSWRRSTPRRCARSTSRSSSTSPTSTRSSTTAPTTSRPTRRDQAVRAAGRGDGAIAEGRHRPVRDAHQAVPRRDAAEGRAARAVHDGLRRRGQRRRGHRRARRLDDVEVNDKELPMAEQLVDSLSGRLRARAVPGHYRDQVLDLIERKAAGETELVPPPAAGVEPTRSSTSWLRSRRSVSAAKEARQAPPDRTARRRRAG